VGHLVVPALFAGVESDPDPADVAGPAVDESHQPAHDGAADADWRAGVGVDDAKVEHSHGDRLAASAPEVDLVAGDTDQGDQVEEDEGAAKDSGGSVLGVLVRGVGADSAPNGGKDEQDDGQGDAEDEAVDKPGDEPDPEAGVCR